MSCPARSDWSFGPRVNTNCRSFDFTIQFEDLFFACLPSAVFLFLAPLNLAFLFRKRSIFSLESKLLFSRLAAFTGVISTQLAFLILRAQDQSWQTDVSLAADILSFTAAGMATVLSLVSYQRSHRPSTLLSVYLSTLVILGIARTRTLWLAGLGSRVPAIQTTSLGLISAALLLETAQNKIRLGPENKPGAPEQYSSFWSRTCFAWLFATLRKGYVQLISVNDLPALDTQLESHVLRAKLVSTWSRYDHQQRHSLLQACFHGYLPSLLSAIIPRLFLTLFTFLQPFLVNTTVGFVGITNGSRDYGKCLIGAWALVFVGLAVSNSIFQYQTTRFVTRLRGGLTALVYQRTLQIRAVDLGETTAVALMGTDIERIVSGMNMLHEVWASLLDVCIATWLLERQLDLACIAPLVIVAVFIAATFKLSLAAKMAQRRWIERVQERLTVTSSLLDNMKAVKIMGISRVMSTIIQNLRRREIETSRVYRKLLVIMLLLSNTPINLAPVATFAVYVIISVFWKNETLLTAQAFTSLALVSLLTTPVVVFIQALPEVIGCLSSFDRIHEYCNYGTGMGSPNEQCKSQSNNGPDFNLQDMGPNSVELARSSPQDKIISFDGQSFGWSKTGSAVVKDLNLLIKPKSITAIVGPVGSGKSTFLESMLGETIAKPNTRLKRTFPIAYCSQQSWLEHTTIRQNIIGASSYEPKWYSVVQTSCGLDIDMRQLEKGDQTRVSSKGHNLSGGQKQRIALARAIYSRRHVILLDDVFSGMDGRTKSTVARSLLGLDGILRKNHATVIFSTHNRDIMALADTVIAFEEGKIVETGSPASLLEKHGYISRLGSTLSNGEVVEESTTERQEPSRRKSFALENNEQDTDAAHTDLRRRNGELSVYRYYLQSSGYTAVALYTGFMILWVFCTEVPTIWLKWWSEANEIHPNQKVGMYMGVYAFLGIFGSLFACIAAWFAFISMISNSATRLHADLLESTMRAPFRFFATTDTGELTNRFSQDMELIDMALPGTLVNYTSTAFFCMAQVIILLIFSRYLGAAVPLFGTILYFLQRFYLRTSRQVRLLGIEAKAPLYTHFLESVAGAATIRAFGWQSHYEERNCRLIDTSQRPGYLLSCIQHWLTFVLDFIVAAVCVVLVSIVVTWRKEFSAGSVGISLVMIVGFSQTLARLITNWTTMESSIGAVARVKRFIIDTESEEGSQGDPPLEWPRAGAIEFKRVSAAYKPGQNSVLKDISLIVQPQQHVAICGRTGSGKTSLVMSLMRMMDVQAGQIMVDGIDVSTISCEELRSRINVLPQDPFLMPGTIRFNIDPFGTSPDEEIIHVLTRVKLWLIIQARGGLDSDMDTAAWSAGQKQLICLARAMVRKSKVLLLDEATSSVDSETEAIMQEIIDTEFKDCTVLAIMHRLEYIERYDRVIVMDEGVLVEDGEPAALADGDTKFASFCKSYR